MRRAMLDVETLDLRVTAVVLSLGLVVVDPELPRPLRYHRLLELEPQQAAGRSIDVDTVRWWALQCDAAQATLAEGRRVHPSVAFNEARQHLAACDEVWCTDRSFDEAILTHMGEQFGLQPLVGDYRRWRDLRTLRALTGDPVVLGGPFEWPEELPAHHALGDCQRQVDQLFALLQRAGWDV